jgi:hypothetical protein
MNFLIFRVPDRQKPSGKRKCHRGVTAILRGRKIKSKWQLNSSSMALCGQPVPLPVPKVKCGTTSPTDIGRNYGMGERREKKRKGGER